MGTEMIRTVSTQADSTYTMTSALFPKISHHKMSVPAYVYWFMFTPKTDEKLFSSNYIDVS